MEDQYGMGDLRQCIDGRPLFPGISQPPDLLSCHRGLGSASYPYDMLIFRQADSAALAPANSGVMVGFEEEGGGAGGGAGRWPRQETLTLLEIRSRLDHKFKEANQKSPLWDEVARIMSQEHGYQRSGKKCREKFENLYKYYKKTKEGKASRQDGKHYRFFRQLEALYGDAAKTNTSAAAAYFPYNFPNQEPYPPQSKVSEASECDTTTSSYCTDDEEARIRKRKGKMRSMKAEMEALIEAQMRSMTEKQEEWMERVAREIEAKEQERLIREEQWRRQDAARIDGEHKMWAAERAWIESRDAALLDAFAKFADPRPPPPLPPPPQWPQNEEAAAWDEIAAKMAACGGDNRSKWDHAIGDYLIKCSKKRKDGNDHGVAGAAANANDGVFRYFIGDSYQRL